MIKPGNKKVTKANEEKLRLFLSAQNKTNEDKKHNSKDKSIQGKPQDAK